jgi:hypothetical protein
VNLLADDAYDLILQNEDYSWFPSSVSLHPLMLKHMWAAAARAALPASAPPPTMISWTMRDGKQAHLCKIKAFLDSKDATAPLTAGVQWRTRNPGGQDLTSAGSSSSSSSSSSARVLMLTGSFHPLPADASGWASVNQWHCAHICSIGSFAAFFFRCFCLRRDRVRQLVCDSVREGLSVENRAYLDSHSVDLVVDYLLLEEMPWSSEEENLQKEAAGKERKVLFRRLPSRFRRPLHRLFLLTLSLSPPSRLCTRCCTTLRSRCSCIPARPSWPRPSTPFCSSSRRRPSSRSRRRCRRCRKSVCRCFPT